MVTLEQKIGAKLAFLMPKGSNIFEVQAYLHDDYGLCFALVHDGDSYQDAQLSNSQLTDAVLEEILSLLYLLQSQKSYGDWRQCQITVNADRHVQFNFSQMVFNVNSNSNDALLDDIRASVMGELGSEVSHNVISVAFDYHVNMLFALALDYATGAHGIEMNRQLAASYFKSLIPYEAVTLAAYYNWVALESASEHYMDVCEFGLLELLQRESKSDVAALYVLGLMHHSGYETLQPNIQQAVHCYQQAAALGCTLAKLRVEDLCLNDVSEVHKLVPTQHKIRFNGFK